MSAASQDQNHAHASYPQYDEPALFENYNLVCFDIRGHGETIVQPLGSSSFAAAEAADDIYLALVSDAL